MKKLFFLGGVAAIFLSGCFDSPYSISRGNFSLKLNDPILRCTIVEEGVKKAVRKICFWHNDYDKKEYNNRKYANNEGGVHIWVRTYSEETKKMTAFNGSIDLTKITNLQVIKKCGSKLYTPDSMPNERFVWILVTDKTGAKQEYLAPASTIIGYEELDGTPGSISLVEIEEITDIKLESDITKGSETSDIKLESKIIKGSETSEVVQ